MVSSFINVRNLWVLKAQDESIGNSGTCCPQIGATCYTLTWGFEISEKLLSIAYDEVNSVLYGLDVSAEEERIFKYIVEI